MEESEEIVRIQYGRTATYLLRGAEGSVLVDTDWAGTLDPFFKALKAEGLEVRDIGYVLCTHWHPDHMGIVGDLERLGVIPVVFDVQLPYIHQSDAVFAKEVKHRFVPVDDAGIHVVPLSESRAFFASLGIAGEAISTPSHSADSVSVLLDSGTFFVGDLMAPDMVAAYGKDVPPELEKDWELLRARHPKRICFAHAGELSL
ncbi:MAG: MBL fold metallo-hydrolase [Atopobiaceae bacterium]